MYIKEIKKQRIFFPPDLLRTKLPNEAAGSFANAAYLLAMYEDTKIPASMDP